MCISERMKKLYVSIVKNYDSLSLLIHAVYLRDDISRKNCYFLCSTAYSFRAISSVPILIYPLLYSLFRRLKHQHLCQSMD